jgi:transposase
MGKRRQKERQEDLWIATSTLIQTPGHAFYDRLNELLREHGFDEKVEHLCGRFYRGPRGRPSMAPGVYFRLLMIGYFEGLDSERGIAWRVADSLSLRKFLGYGLDEQTPDHSTISRTRRLLWLSTHRAVFEWVLSLVDGAGLLGKTVAIDATQLEANAAMRSIVRRDSGKGYREYLKELATEAGIENPTPGELARFDRKRKKKMSNQDWRHPHDPDARIARMKDGRTRMTHKVEHAVDLSSGALRALTVQPGDVGDTHTVFETLAATRVQAEPVGPRGVEEVVTDKGYHSDEVLIGLHERAVRSYVSEPDRGRRRWNGKGEAQARVYANRRRLRGERSKRLHRKRGELGERSFAHMYETGGMRRVYLRGSRNVEKRILIHGAGFNLSIVMRQRHGVGKPRARQGLSELFSGIISALRGVHMLIFRFCARIKTQPTSVVWAWMPTTRTSTFAR